MGLKLNTTSGSITLVAEDGSGNADVTVPRSGIGSVSSLSDLSITATATELNYVDGVTSAIQTQLDDKVGSTYTGNVDITGDLTVDGITVGTVTFPSTNGTNGYVLTTDGSGTASWAEASGGLDQTTATTSSTTQTAIASYSATTYGSAKLIISVKRGTDRQMSELLVVHNDTTASATEYAQIYTSGSLATFDVDISGGNVRLLATAASATSTSYTVKEILVDA
jgi:hypothetical protein